MNSLVYRYIHVFGPWIVGIGFILLANYMCDLNAYQPSNIGVLWDIEMPILILIAFVNLCYAIFASTRLDMSFMRAFGHVSRSYWTYGALFVLVMIALNATWLKIIEHNLFPDFEGQTFFLWNRWDDIKQTVILSPVKEEPLYRVLPFLFASILLLIVWSKGWRIVLAILLAIMIVCVQLQFGFRHYVGDDFAEIFNDSLKLHLFIQGGGGIIYATAYGVVLYKAYWILRKKYPNKNRYLMLLLANLWGGFASCLVHGGYNYFCIIDGT